MATLTLKDLPEDLHAELKRRAKAHGRSLNQEILASLREVAFARPLDVEQFLALARGPAVRRAAGGLMTHD